MQVSGKVGRNLWPVTVMEVEKDASENVLETLNRAGQVSLIQLSGWQSNEDVQLSESRHQPQCADISDDTQVEQSFATRQSDKSNCLSKTYITTRKVLRTKKVKSSAFSIENHISRTSNNIHSEGNDRRFV